MPRRSLLIAICLLVTGCGGGGGIGGDQQQSGASGNVTFTYTRASSVMPAAYSQSNGAVINALAGANFTKVQLNPIKSLNATRIAASVLGQIWLMNANGGNPVPIGPPTNDANPCSPAWYPNGSLLAFVRIDNNGLYQIWRINPDGTGLRQLTSATTIGAFNPAWSPGGSKIAYWAYDASIRGNIWTMNPDGTGQTQITPSGNDDRYPVWSSDGSKIYILHRNGGSTLDIDSVPPGGGAYTVEQPLGLTQLKIFAVSPYGEFAIPNDSNVIEAGYFGKSPFTIDVPPSGSIDYWPSFSPDGQSIIFWRYSPSGDTIYINHASGSDTAYQLSDSQRHYESPAWGPYPGNRTLVGTGGPLGTTAAAFLFGQVHDVMGSFVSIGATTPSTCTVTPQSGSGNTTNAVFQVNADAITSLKYMTDIYSSVTQIIPGSFTTATGAIISFDTFSGQIVLVAPFSSAKRSVTKSGSLAYSGKFLGVWNASGKNLAPSGAGYLEVDPSKGTLLHIN